jgi:beta-phosphoglucomutase-like phosphatase (HAD superfamily)
VIVAVIFDLDGVLLDSEQLWDRARRETVDSYGGRWPPHGTHDMQGMSSTEWAAYLEHHAGIEASHDQIVEDVLERLLAYYRDELPLVPGATAAVGRMAAQWPLGLASSSNRPVIDAALALAGLQRLFTVTLSSEEVPRGKPSPDVYFEVTHRLNVKPSNAVAVEDSVNGIRSAKTAGLFVAALPNQQFPPPTDVLETAGLVLRDLDELTVEALVRADKDHTQ